MPKFLDTRGRSSLGIGICARCSVKYPIDELSPDPNSPGLLVCPDGCKDDFDPWRLSPRETEDMSLPYVRPDTNIATQGPSPVYANQIGGISSVLFTVPWTRNTSYLLGASVTPLSVDLDTTTLPQLQMIALNAGVSGAVAPVWPIKAGGRVIDGTVLWQCVGIYVN